MEELNDFMLHFIENNNIYNPKLKSSKLVHSFILNGGRSITDLSCIIVDNNIETDYTGILLLDLNINNKENIINITNKYNGICYIYIDHEKNKTNKLYAVFTSPILTFNFIMDVMKTSVLSF